MVNLAKGPLAAALLVTIGAASAQEVDLSACLGLQDSAERTECFREAYSSPRPEAGTGVIKDLPTGPELPAGWTETRTTNEMTGVTSHYVLTPSIPALRRMAFPYHDTTVKLAVGCNANNEWPYFVFSQAPNFTGGDLRSGYSVINADVLWGDDIVRYRLTHDHGARFLMFSDRDGPEAIRRIESSERMVAQFSWYGEGSVQFAVRLDGGAQALDYLRDQCATL